MGAERDPWCRARRADLGSAPRVAVGEPGLSPHGPSARLSLEEGPIGHTWTAERSLMHAEQECGGQGAHPRGQTQRRCSHCRHGYFHSNDLEQGVLKAGHLDDLAERWKLKRTQKGRQNCNR